MATLTVEMDKERDLPALRALLSRMGLKFYLEDEDWNGLSDEEIEGIRSGLDDIEAGRVHSHEYVMAEMNKKVKEFQKK